MHIESVVAEIMSHPDKYGGLPPRAESDLVLSCWTNFSLGIWSTWSVFTCGSSFFARRIEWARTKDSIRVAGEAPTTFGSESPLPFHLAAGLIASARVLTLDDRITPYSGLTIDGVARRLFVRLEDGEAASKEWQKGFEGAESLDSWLEQASAQLNKVLPASSARLAPGAA